MVTIWWAFVYSEKTSDDRAKQAYNEFQPLDGKFRDNVIVQVKTGAIDFQPREPFHPLFGAMPETPLMMEFQITQEYLGQSTHLGNRNVGGIELPFRKNTCFGFTMCPGTIPLIPAIELFGSIYLLN